MNYMETKPWYKSKLLWYATLTGLAGALAILTQQYPTEGKLALLNAVIVGLLRFVTAQPIVDNPPIQTEK